MALSFYEQYLYHVRKFMTDYHLSFGSIENMPLEFLLDLEVVDSKIEAAFEEKRQSTKGGKNKPFNYPKRTIDQIMNF